MRRSTVLSLPLLLVPLLQLFFIKPAEGGNGYVTHLGCTIKPMTTIINSVAKKASVFVPRFFKVLCKEATLFVELSSFQISKLNNRLTVRNLIKTGSKTSSLIDHKCRLSFIAIDVFSLPYAVVDVDQRCWGFRPTLAHTLLLSLCLSAILLSSPFFRLI
jgi:hypothetical protein